MTSVFAPLIALLYEETELTIQVDNWNCSLFGSNMSSANSNGSCELVLFGKLYSPRFESDKYFIDGSNLRELSASIRLRPSEDWEAATAGLLSATKFSEGQRQDIEKAKGLLIYTSGQIDGILAFGGDAIKEFYKLLLSGLNNSAQLRFTIRHETDHKLGCFIVNPARRTVSWDGKDGLLVSEARIVFSEGAIREPAQLRKDAHKLILSIQPFVDFLYTKTVRNLIGGLVFLVYAVIIIYIIRYVQSRP